MNDPIKCKIKGCEHSFADVESLGKHLQVAHNIGTDWRDALKWYEKQFPDEVLEPVSEATTVPQEHYDPLFDPSKVKNTESASKKLRKVAGWPNTYDCLMIPSRTAHIILAVYSGSIQASISFLSFSHLIYNTFSSTHNSYSRT